MKPIIELLTIETLKDLASRSNFRYGQEIAKNGDIAFDKSNTFHLIAKVQFRGGESRTVDFLSTPKGLRWKCTCTSKKDFFCKHTVAAGLALQAPSEEAEE